jgi:hypothetical protein
VPGMHIHEGSPCAVCGAVKADGDKRVNVFMAPTLYQRLERQANAEGMNVSEAVREAVRRWLPPEPAAPA